MKNYLRKIFLLISMGVLSSFSSNVLAGWPGQCWIIRASNPIEAWFYSNGVGTHELGFNQETGKFKLINYQNFPNGTTLYKSRFIEAWYYEDDKWHLHSSNYYLAAKNYHTSSPATTMPNWVDGFHTGMSCGDLPSVYSNLGDPPCVRE